MAEEIIKILIVENDERDIETYTDTINTINNEKKGLVKLEPTVKKTKVDGLESLEKNDWAAAFIHLKLSTGDILNAKEGNEIVEEIYHKKRFPVYILTNTPTDVDSKFEESIFLRINSKDNINYHDVFSEIVNIFETGILNILGKKGIIEKYLDEIFWKNISYSLDEWFLVKDQEKHLLRYILSHFQAYLEIAEDGTFDYYHPIETYIYPTIKQHRFTGDILKSKGTNDLKYYIILTPACDLALHGLENKPKTDRVLLAEIESHSDGVFAFLVRKIQQKSDAEIGLKCQEKLLRLIKNNYADQFFYLPSSKIFKGGSYQF